MTHWGMFFLGMLVASVLLGAGWLMVFSFVAMVFVESGTIAYRFYRKK